MTQWTPELEKTIRKLGNALDKQMKYFVNPKKGVLASALNVTFWNAARVIPLQKKAYEAAGLDIKPARAWKDGHQKLIEIAEANGSNAADKIKQWLPVTIDVSSQFDSGFVNQTKFAKQKYGH